jgi:pyridoxal biosynthesis lyase PdxS
MEQQTGTFAVKKGLAQMLRRRHVDVVTVEHART